MQDTDIIKLLLNVGIPLNNIDFRYQSLLKYVLGTCDKKVINLVLGLYADKNINPTDNKGFTPLHIACCIGNVNLVKKFLNCGDYVNCCVNANVKSFPGFSPLHFAVKSESVKTAEILLNHGADITLKSSDGRTPFYLACENKIEPIKDLLMMIHYTKNVCAVKDKGFSILYKNLFYKHMVHFNVSCTLNLNASWTSWAPLHFAIAQQKTEIVEFLLNHEAKINVKDDLGITPLHLACQCTYTIFSKIVLANSDSELDNWIVNQNEQIKIVKLLLEHKSNVNVIDKCGKTPLFHALENFVKIHPIKVSHNVKMDLIKKRKQLIHLLLQYGADVTISDNEGVTVLHDLSECDVVFDEDDKIEMAQVFLNKGANVNAKTKADKTPLFLSIRNKFIGLAKLLIINNADINCTCNIYNRFTPLHALTYYSEYNTESVSLLNTLLENGADVHATEVDEATALHIAIDCHGIERDISDEKDEMAVALLKHGAEVDARDRNGQTPLHRACLNRYTKGTIVLLDHGADINVKDEFDNTPLSCACYRVQEENNTIFFNTIRHHVNKLKFIGFHVSKKNESSLMELEKFYAHRFTIPKIDEFLSLCAYEVEKMKKTIIDNYTTLYDILFKNLNDMSSHVKNDKFVQILKSNNFLKEFELYGFLLKIQLEKGLKRAELMEPADESLRILSKSDLPDLCIKMIFEHLSDCDLQELISAQNMRM